MVEAQLDFCICVASERTAGKEGSGPGSEERLTSWYCCFWLAVNALGAMYSPVAYVSGNTEALLVSQTVACPDNWRVNIDSSSTGGRSYFELSSWFSSGTELSVWRFIRFLTRGAGSWSAVLGKA